MINIKRFSYRRKRTRRGPKREKLSTYLSFPARGLDVGAYCCGVVEAGAMEGRDTVYDLAATSNHVGSCSEGHYEANCRNEGEWYTFNDSTVTPVSGPIPEIRLAGSSPYLLFYTRTPRVDGDDELQCPRCGGPHLEGDCPVEDCPLCWERPDFSGDNGGVVHQLEDCPEADFFAQRLDLGDIDDPASRMCDIDPASRI